MPHVIDIEQSETPLGMIPFHPTFEAGEIDLRQVCQEASDVYRLVDGYNIITKYTQSRKRRAARTLTEFIGRFADRRRSCAGNGGNYTYARSTERARDISADLHRQRA
jgi:hypothetical protein